MTQNHVNKFICIKNTRIRKTGIKFWEPTLYTKNTKEFSISLFFSYIDFSKKRIIKFDNKTEYKHYIDYLDHEMND